MEKKHVSGGMLLLSLFTVAVYNDVKTAEKKPPDIKDNNEITRLKQKLFATKKLLKECESDHPITKSNNPNLCQLKLSESQSALAKCQEHSTSLENQLQNNIKKWNESDQRANQIEARLLNINSELADTRSSLSKFQTIASTPEKAHQEFSRLRRTHSEILIQHNKNSDLEEQLEQQTTLVNQLKTELKKLQNQFENDRHVQPIKPNQILDNRCRPYICGKVIAEAVHCLFSLLSETDVLKKSEYFPLLHQSVKHSKQLQLLSFTAACYGGRPHQFLNKNSAGTDSSSDGCKAGLANVVGETANAVALRWGWNHLTASYFITRHRKKIDSNPIATFTCKLPKPIKKACLNFGYLCAIRTLWNIQKTVFKKL